MTKSNFQNIMIEKAKYFLLAIAVIGLVSCADDDAQNAKLQVVLVDAPATYDAVNVDVQQVNVKLDTGWTDISKFDPQVINLLDLVNGNEAVLADADIAAGRLGEVRLVLGDDNAIVVDGETIDLTVPSGSESGLKIKINEDLLSGVTYKLILDFDAAKSIVRTGSSGAYNLKPVIHASMDAQTGAIAGAISPAVEGIVIYAIVNQDSVSTYTDASGEFLLRALDANTYNLAAISETDTVRVEGVEVVIGEVTNVDDLIF